MVHHWKRETHCYNVFIIDRLIGSAMATNHASLCLLFTFFFLIVDSMFSGKNVWERYSEWMNHQAAKNYFSSPKLCVEPNVHIFTLMRGKLKQTKSIINTYFPLSYICRWVGTAWARCDEIGTKNFNLFATKMELLQAAKWCHLLISPAIFSDEKRNKVIMSLQVLSLVVAHRRIFEIHNKFKAIIP